MTSFAPNVARMMDKACFFAHYDRDNVVAPYVRHYVEAIARAGFEVMFVTTCAISQSDIDQLRTVCRDVIVRHNDGYDFGSWSEAMKRHGDHVAGELLLTNDSVYAPIGDLEAAIAKLRGLGADMAGPVDSLEHAPHLQSWFLLFSPRAQKSAAFRAVLQSDFNGLTKDEIIRAGELRLSQEMRSAGFSVKAAFPVAPIWPVVGRFNPSHHLWRQLIDDQQLPFLKVQLLRDNPLAIADLKRWRAVVAHHAPPMETLIAEHLARVGGRDAIEGTGTHAIRLSPLRPEAWFTRAYRLRNKRRFLLSLNRLGFRIANAAHDAQARSRRWLQGLGRGAAG